MPFIHTYQSHGDASIQFGNNTCLFWKCGTHAQGRHTHTHIKSTMRRELTLTSASISAASPPTTSNPAKLELDYA